MGTNSGVQTTYMGHTLGEISDLTGIDSRVIADRWSHPQDFTLAEAAALAPHVGMTTAAFVARAVDEVSA